MGEIRWDPLVHGVATSVKNAVPETETKSVRKKRALSQSAAKEKVPWPSRRVSSCRSRTTETIFLSNSTRMPKGRRKKRTPQVDGIERRKKERQRGGTKEDKSLRGTTTGTCDTSDQTKHKSKRTQGNV